MSSSLTVLGLPAGKRVVLRLVATGAGGRRGSASVTVRVKGDAPRFTSLTKPAKLAKGKRSLKLRLSSTIPAALTVSGSGVKKLHATVRPRPHSVTVKLRKKTGTVRLKLRLASGRKARTVTVTIPRG